MEVFGNPKVWALVVLVAAMPVFNWWLKRRPPPDRGAIDGEDEEPSPHQKRVAATAYVILGAVWAAVAANDWSDAPPGEKTFHGFMFVIAAGGVVFGALRLYRLRGRGD